MNKDVIKKWLNIKFFELKLCLFKRKRTTKNVIKLIINKELLKFGVDYDYIVKNQKINNEMWYEYYKFANEKEYLQWRKYSVKAIKKYLGYSKKTANKEFSFFSLNYSLKFDFDYNGLDDTSNKK